MGFPAPWPYLMSGLRQMQKDALSDKSQGFMTAALVEAPPLEVQALPLGSFSMWWPNALGSRWKELLKAYIDNGKRPNKFA